MHLLLQNLDLKKFLQGLARLSSGLTKIKFCMLKSHKIFCVCAHILLERSSQTRFKILLRIYQNLTSSVYFCYSFAFARYS